MVFNTIGGDKRDRTADLLNAIHLVRELSVENLENVGITGQIRTENIEIVSDNFAFFEPIHCEFITKKYVTYVLILCFLDGD